MVAETQRKQAAQLVARGIAALKAKDVRLARQHLLQARKLDPENVDALLWLTRTTRDPDKRRAILRQVLQIDPTHAQARRALKKLGPPAAPGAQAADSGFEMPRFVDDEEPVSGLRARVKAVPPPSLPEVPPAPSPAQLLSDEEPFPVELPTSEPEVVPPQVGELVLLEAEVPVDAADVVEAVGEVAEETPVDDLPLPESAGAVAVEPASPVMPVEEPIDEPVVELRTQGPVIVPDAPMEPPISFEVPEPVEASVAESSTSETMDASAEPDVDDLLAELALPDTAELAPVSAEAAAAASEVKRCPQCNSAMTLSPQTGEYYCVYCGYGMAGDTVQVVPAESLYPETPWPSVQRARHCLTCDSISLVSAKQGGGDAVPCPVCQQTVLEPAELTLSLPDGYLPFSVSEAEAAIAIEDVSSGGLRRLFGGGKRDMSAPRQLYIPVWLFSGVGYLEYDFPGFEGRGGIYTESYKLLPVHGLPHFDGRLLRLASSVDLEGAPRFTSGASRDVPILLPNVSLQSALHEARGLMLNDTRQKARRRISPPTPASLDGDSNMLTRQDAFAGAAIASASRGEIPMTTVKSEVQEMVYQLFLFPVWINEVREGNRVSMGMVNGVTGQATLGDLVRRRRR